MNTVPAVITHDGSELIHPARPTGRIQENGFVAVGSSGESGTRVMS